MPVISAGISKPRYFLATTCKWKIKKSNSNVGKANRNNPKAEVTFRMCNLGSRLQSASVSSGPSRKFLEDSGRSPEASASISEGRGVLRKSSRRRRDFSKAFSKAAVAVKNGYKKVKYVCSDTQGQCETCKISQSNHTKLNL